MARSMNDAAACPPAAFVWTLRVYWEDTDAGGIVFYANYLKFFERARTEWLRSLGVVQSELRARDGLMFVVSETALRYLAPARLDDLIDVDCALSERGRASLVIEQRAWRGATLLCAGRIRIGCVEAATLKPARLPPALDARLAEAAAAAMHARGGRSSNPSLATLPAAAA
jgi:acyl-CoA thioester hydrolase